MSLPFFAVADSSDQNKFDSDSVQSIWFQRCDKFILQCCVTILFHLQSVSSKNTVPADTTPAVEANIFLLEGCSVFKAQNTAGTKLLPQRDGLLQHVRT